MCRTRCSTPSSTTVRRRSSPRPAARARSPSRRTWPAAVRTSSSAATPTTSPRRSCASAASTRSSTSRSGPRRCPPRWRSAEAAVKAEFEEVKELGGLYVLGTERHESRRIDNQLRGRSGRQGDPGESRFYLSLGDDLMRLFKAQMVERVMSMANVPDDVPIENKMVTRAIASAQSQVEQQNFETRKNVLKYDEVLNRQREVIYGERRRVLEGEDLQEQIRHFMDDTIDDYIQAGDRRGLRRGVGPGPAVGRVQAALPGEGHRRRAGGRGRRPGRASPPSSSASPSRTTSTSSTTSVRSSSARRSCVSWSGGWCCRSWTASGVSTSTRWTTSRRASACGPWRRRTRWSSTSARASTCSTP